MTGRSLSQTKKAQHKAELQEKWMQRAIEIYQEERGKPVVNGQKRKGYRAVCAETELVCYQETKVKISLCSSTLQRRVNGGRGLRQFNLENKAWLTSQQAETVISYAISLADQGFPLSHRRLQEHVDEICRARYGDNFPGVGKQWTNRFVTKYSDRLKSSWSHPLDHSRARAVNKITKDAFFDLLEDTVKGKDGDEPIPPELHYGVDETGIQNGIGLKERVLAGTGTKVQYQQRSGDRENITVIVTICGDGTSTPPAVIFKGEGYQMSWKQDNPLNASLGYSTKGYTDSEIGVAWMEHFDRYTRNKAAGHRRLLLVDGHNSHYTRGFLEYARTHHIHVLCYPSHSTHIYQGLDVVIFSILKRQWSKARDEYERTHGQNVTKSNFLSIYAKAHMNALTKENIMTAFRKTGVIPLDRSVVTEQMMAPSQQTSTEGTCPLPVATPVRIISGLIRKHIERQMGVSDHTSEGMIDGAREDSPVHIHTTRTHSPQLSSPTRDALASVASSSSTAFLTTLAPLNSHSRPPNYMPAAVSPLKQYRNQRLLGVEPQTKQEQLLQNALREAKSRDFARKEMMIGMQASAVLQGLWTKRVQTQLQSQTDKQKKSKKKLFGDGMPKLLDSDAFFARVVDNEARIQNEKREKAQKATQREERAKEIAEWKIAESAWVARNKERREVHKVAVEAWEVEREKAKSEKRKLQWKKPKLEGIEKPVPRPKAVELTEDSDSSDPSDDDNGNEMDDD